MSQPAQEGFELGTGAGLGVDESGMSLFFLTTFLRA